MEQLPPVIHESWHPLIANLFEDESMKFLKNVVLRKEHYYPERENIFKVFRMRVDDIKVVIIGQDPYSKKGQATGLAFAVNEDQPIPPSLRVILEDNGIVARTFDRTLERWETQGVFLLNSALTVRRNDPGSHIKHWAYFTTNVIKALSAYKKSIYLLWGTKAIAYQQYIKDPFEVNKEYKFITELEHNLIFTAGHPASELYSDSKGKFYGSYHLRKANEILTNMNKRIIF